MAEDRLSLKEFVSDSLVQIVAGVTDAQEKTSKQGARISPQGYTPHDKMDSVLILPSLATTTRYGQYVDFDVAVTARGIDKAEGGTGIFVAALALGVKGSEETESSAISRLKFRVPVFLPVS